MIIPALDLIKGHIVRLYQGDYKKVTPYNIDPFDQFDLYQKSGANYLHLVDLSGAKNVHDRQLSLITALIKSTCANIQVGGGIRQKEEVNDLLHAGAMRVVIGSVAVNDPKRVKAWINEFSPERIVLALDIHINEKGERLVAVSGWQENSGITVEALLDDYLRVGLKHVLCTDISKDGTLKGANVPLYTSLCKAYPQIKWQSSGGIGSLADIQALKNTGVCGVIVGRALLEEKFTLKEAISCWQNA